MRVDLNRDTDMSDDLIGVAPKKPSMVDQFFQRAENGENHEDVANELSSKYEPITTDPDTMLQDKLAKDTDSEKGIQAAEDAINDRADHDLQKGILGGMNTIAAQSMKNLGQDSRAIDQGYKNAADLVDSSDKVALTNRQFLKDKMGRSSDATKAMSDSLGLKARVRGENMASATQAGSVAAENAKNEGVVSQANMAKQNADPTSVRNRVMSNAHKSILEGIVAKGGKNAEYVKPILRDYDQGLGQLASGDRELIMNQVKSLAEKNKGFALRDVAIGDNQGFVVVDLDTGEYGKPVMGRKTTAVDVAEAKAAAVSMKNLSDKQVEIISTYDRTLDEMDRIMEEKKTLDIDTGHIAGRLNSVAHVFGIDDPKVSNFKARVGQQLALYIRGISGAAVSGPERQDLEDNMPTMNDNDKTFNEKMQTLKRRITAHRNIDLSNYAKQGKNAAPFQADIGKAPPNSSTTDKAPPNSLATDKAPPNSSTTGTKPGTIKDDNTPVYDGDYPPAIKKGK